MKIINNIVKPALVAVGFTLVLSSCGAGHDDPGYEYMPNMYRSPSLETYAPANRLPNEMTAQQPVAHTIPRGFMPFDFGSSLEEYKRAGLELTNPLEANAENLKAGKELYLQFCAHCHGKKGDGKGTIKNPIYGGVPSYQDGVAARRSGGPMSELKDGHIYHTIVYGLNAMGPHASQLMPEERWKIVQYVHELQKGKK
jgi:mono/diheme cytochrome c family protein